MGTKDKIIQASIELFNQHGERSITTNHIASHLGISPGNLYYHFKNKEDIIRHIFGLYRDHLYSRFKPISANDNALFQLEGYLDALFELMWNYHFFYDNLTDILARDELLKKDYIAFQKDLFSHVRKILLALRDKGVMTLPAEQVDELTHTLKLIVSSWTAYVKARRLEGPLTRQDVYRGIRQVLLLLSAFANEEANTQIAELQRKYQLLAELQG